jgi:thiosulfate/3-mercaptopyruvate sulfurtransferase
MQVSGYPIHVLVDADWALTQLGNPAVRFVEVDVDTTAYEHGHLPGAVGWNWTTQLSDPVVRDIADTEAMTRLLSDAGIGPDTTVVLYGDNNNWFAAWAFWQLRIYGQRHLRILDGGRRYWVDQGLPLTTDVPVYASVSPRVTGPDFGLRAFRSELLRRVEGDVSLRLVDVRSAAEFSGDVIAPPGMTETAQRGGHIPGARSIPWARTVAEDGRFRHRDEVLALYAEHDVTAEHDVVTYCRIGERSSHSWFVLRELLEFPRVRNYDGSWTEWGSMVGVPIERASALPSHVAAAA